MIWNTISQILNGIYITFSEQIPDKYKPLVILAFYTLIIVAYGIFVLKFYKFLARRDIINLNLSKYNETEHPFWNKIFASGLYLLEYVVIIPILVFFWFSILAIFLLLLSKNQDVSQILLISGAIIAATRIAAYYSGDLSKDLAKMFPFTVLVIFLLEPEFFSVSKLIIRFSEIPSLFGNILIYLVFIAALEIFIRGLFTFIALITSSGENS